MRCGSLVYPMTILSPLPAAGIGALPALFALDTGLSAIPMIALALPIGSVGKNTLMMIGFVWRRSASTGWRRARPTSCASARS